MSWFLAQNRFDFVSLPWKVHNRYCHDVLELRSEKPIALQIFFCFRYVVPQKKYYCFRMSLKSFHKLSMHQILLKWLIFQVIMRLQHLHQILMLQNITIMTLKPALITVSHIVFVIWKVSFDFRLFHVVRDKHMFWTNKNISPYVINFLLKIS